MWVQCGPSKMAQMHGQLFLVDVTSQNRKKEKEKTKGFVVDVTVMRNSTNIVWSGARDQWLLVHTAKYLNPKD